jgi:RhtB (resistance to homoserine/threonine) family protein
VDGILHFETFLLTGILLNITPGNDTIFILSRSIAQGRKAGIISALGIGTGCLVHTLLAAFGLSLVIAKSMLLFNIIRYAGAVYLIYVGYKMLSDKSGFSGGIDNNTNIKSRYLKVYRDGILTNLLNPKVALFFIAFLPQFINPEMKNTIAPFLILGVTFIITGTVWCLMLAVFAASLFSRLQSNTKASRIINLFCGWALIGLGVKVAVTASK